jgi:putative sporulation protein YyaC
MVNNTYFNSDNKDIVEDLSNYLYKLIVNINLNYKDIVILCIGTDRSTGDSLAPTLKYNNTYVLGNLDNPVHAKNLDKTIYEIYEKYENPLVIAIDATLGEIENVGCIKAKYGSIKAGSGVGKELPSIGNISIVGVVNFNGVDNFSILQNTRLSVVMKMSEIIADSIKNVLVKFKNDKLVTMIA